MKKIVLTICLFIGYGQTITAQVDFGIKAGFNYNSDSFTNVKNDVFSGAEGKAGFHGGLWVRKQIPLLGIYLRPEFVYTKLQNKVVYTNIASIATSTTYSLKKLDVPILLGKKVFNLGHIFIGPSFQYTLSSDFGLDELKKVNSDGFTVGLQLGGGIEIGKVGLDIRWEKGFTDLESTFLDSSSTIKFSTSVNQIIVGISYQF